MIVCISDLPWEKFMLLLKMHLVKEAMHGRCKDIAYACDE
jgi:hypothetical protein